MISTLLWENPWLLLGLLVVIQFALISIWSRQRSRTWARIVWIGFGALPTMLLLSHFVVTPRERIINLCHDLAHRVDEGNVAGIGPYLADDFEAAGLDRSAFLNRAEKMLTRHHVDKPKLRGFEITFPHPDEGIATFTVQARIRSEGVFLDWSVTRWQLGFRRRGDVWQVTQVAVGLTPLSPLHPVSRWLR